MYALLANELEMHDGRTVFIANKDDDYGTLHYYLSSEFPMMTDFDFVITRKLRELEAQLGLTCGSPIAYCKLVLRSSGVITMGIYFSDIGERSTILDPSDFPKLTKDEDED